MCSSDRKYVKSKRLFPTNDHCCCVEHRYCVEQVFANAKQSDRQKPTIPMTRQRLALTCTSATRTISQVAVAVREVVVLEVVVREVAVQEVVVVREVAVRQVAVREVAVREVAVREVVVPEVVVLVAVVRVAVVRVGNLGEMVQM